MSLVLPSSSEPPTDRLVTGEELLLHPEWGPCELIRGKVVRTCLPNKVHGAIMGEMIWSLLNHTKKDNLGFVAGGKSGVFLERGPDTVRGPDIYFIRHERLSEKTLQPTYLEVPPDLCAEIVSPNDRWSDLEQKVTQYLKFGVKLVWVIDAYWKRARVFRLNGTSDIVSEAGALSGKDVLPGFQLPLSQVFSVLERQ